MKDGCSSHQAGSREVAQNPNSKEKISQNSHVAIVGYSFRFPGDVADEPTFWDALVSGRDLVTQIPAERWATEQLRHSKRSEPGRSVTFSAGVLSHVDEFDADFFGISPREATWLDPQQRLLLELSWEAFENAGIPPASMASTDCAVYVGISGFEYGLRGLDDLAAMTAHSMTGNTLSLAANRISYVFDLHGPSLAVNTACSSSLVAVHHACNCLRNGEASSALVGGVSLLLHPQSFVGFSKASMLSANGRCKPFDASGDGYVRSEGGAVLLLKLLDKALADGDEIQAIILASGVNTDGARKTGITIPSSDAQAELMRSVLARSGLSPADIDFVEAHGTGTAVGDPIETAAIGRVYGGNRVCPLPIGSVKANLGHLEPASGMAGLIKTVLALKNRALPPALHLKTPNPRIDFKALNLGLVTEYKTLEKAQNKSLVAGVNSFGFGGANGHVLLQEYRPLVAEVGCKAEVPNAEELLPLFLSARSDDALRAMARRYADLLSDKNVTSYYDVAYAAAFQRDRLEKRLVVSPADAGTVADCLRSFAEGDQSMQVLVEDALPQSGKIAFVYSGNGAQWVGMCREMLGGSPRFAEIIAEVDLLMRPQTGFSLVDELQAARLDDTTISQPLLFAIQVAVTILLRESGIEPSAVAGHSVGEIAAAWASGALDLGQAVRVICVRSQAQGLTRGQGRMAALGMSATSAVKHLADLHGELDIEIAGINSPESVTLSGNFEDLKQVQALLDPKSVFFRLLDLDYAFHSRQMDPIQVRITERLADLTPNSAKGATFVSTVTGSVLKGEALDASYWWKNIREPVRFSDAVTKMAELGCRVFIEIGPNAIMQRYVSESLKAVGVKGRVLPTLRRNDGGARRVAEAALRAHLLVDNPNFTFFFPRPGRRVRLPNYPWQRERFWHPQTSEALLSIARYRVHPLLGSRLPESEATWENVLDPIAMSWLEDHKVAGAIVFPGSAYAEMALSAAREWFGGTQFAVEQIDIVSPMVFGDEHSRVLRFVLNPRDGGFQIKSRQRLSTDEWALHAAGRLLESVGQKPVPHIGTPAEPTRLIGPIEHYQRASLLGLEYGPAFQGVGEVRVGKDRLSVELVAPETACTEDYLLHPAQMDVCFQSLVDFFSEEIDAGQGKALLPIKIGRLDFYGKGVVARFHAYLRHRTIRSVQADFELLDGGNNLIASVVGCRFRVAHLMGRSKRHETNWQIVPWLAPHPLDGSTVDVPPVSELVSQARISGVHVHGERQHWFKEALPLYEVLVLSFANEALKKLTHENPFGHTEVLACSQVTPYFRWLVDLLNKEGGLGQNADRWDVFANTDLPSSVELWQNILREFPECLPSLTSMGRMGRRLPAVLMGEVETQEFLNGLHHSPIAEVLYNADPAYLGIRLAIEGVLRHLAEIWGGACRLRILEIAAGASQFPKILNDVLSEDRFDYVLALPDQEVWARQKVEYKDCPNIVVTTFDHSDFSLAEGSLSSDVFDVVIVRHVLHRTTVPLAALAQIKRRLAAGGALLLAERHPDWSVNFLEGIVSEWWHESAAEKGAPMSSLLSPESWQQTLTDAGFTECELFSEPAAEDLAEGAYLVLAKRPREDIAVLPEPVISRWMLLVDTVSAPLANGLRVRLEAQGQQVIIANQIQTGQSQLVDHVAYLKGWGDTPVAASALVAELSACVQLLVSETENTPRFWLVTHRGALASQPSMPREQNPAQCALWGFGRVAMNECPQLSCTLIDLACDFANEYLSARLEKEFLRPDGLNEIIISENARHCLVMCEAPVADRPVQTSSRFRLDFHVPGQLRNLVWLPEQERLLGDDEIEVETRAVGLNFRDVMYLMGLLPDEAVENGFAGTSLGLEFSGVVLRIGERVKNLLPGDPVMGFGSSCFSSHVYTRSDAVVPIPEGWSFEAAATVPTAFLTIYYALRHLANLQPGERVLIHGAAGGVGIAAIQLARHLGAEIFATAGSDEKRDFVVLLGADHVFDSRSLSFADEILSVTEGEGVDVVLNSLAGEAMRRSLEVLKPFGRFLELGKRDFFENTPIGLRPLRNNISYFGIDADQLMTGRHKVATRLFHEVMALFRDESLAPLPYRTFSADKIHDAFRVMQQSRHIGKIVVSFSTSQPCVEHPVRQSDELKFSGSGTWLVTGGLSGFGLESARWLVRRGVSNLVLVGRRGMETPGAREAVEALIAEGVHVLALACDVTKENEVVTLIERVRNTMPPLKGVLHAAAIFDDQLITHLDSASVKKVMDAKLMGGWHLHRATRDIPLDQFILYSSVTTAIGNPGQANYVAANAGLEGLAAMRRSMGLPAVCVSWGAIGDAGYLARNEAIRNSLAQRLGKTPLAAIEALAQLDSVLLDNAETSIRAEFDWETLARLLPSSSGVRFKVLNQSLEDRRHVCESLNIRALIAGKPAEEIACIVRELVTQEVSKTLCVAVERIEPTRPLHDLGMDSLMAVDLALGLEQTFDIKIPVMMLNEVPTVEKVTEHVLEKLLGIENPDVVNSTALLTGIAQQHGEMMTVEEIHALSEAVHQHSAVQKSLIA